MRRSIMTGDYRKDREILYLSALKTPKVHIVPKEHPEVDIYLFEDDKKNRPCALVFSGKKAKADIYIQFVTQEQREKRISEYLKSIADSKAFKAKMKAEHDQPSKLVVGDILHYSWGYDQTNCDFYQVIESKGRTVKIREIASESMEGSEGFMCDRRLPVKDAFLENAPVLTKRVSHGDHVAIESYGSCSLWDGKPCYCSWYA